MDKYKRVAQFVTEQHFNQMYRERHSVLLREAESRPSKLRRALHKDYSFETPYLSNDAIEWFELTGFDFEFYYWERPSTLSQTREEFFLLVFSDDFAKNTFRMSFDLQ